MSLIIAAFAFFEFTFQPFTLYLDVLHPAIFFHVGYMRHQLLLDHVATHKHIHTSIHFFIHGVAEPLSSFSISACKYSECLYTKELQT